MWRHIPDSERVIQWAGLRGDRLILVAAAAYDDGSCIGTEGAELAAMERRLAAAVAASPLPAL